MADATATPETKTRAKADVSFGVLVTDLDSLPPTQRGRRSPLHALIDEVKELVESGKVKPGKPVMVANYGKAESAQSTATSLRHMYGKNATANGLTIAVRKVDVDGSDRAGLFVMYDPSKITDEGKAQHAKDVAEAARKQAERNAKKAAEAATATANGGKGTSAAKK